jgi:PiT family inorganic phosphate transporter
MDHFNSYIILAAIFSFFMAWGMGANDVANAMGTSVGSKAINMRVALLIAAIFEFLGSLLAGGEVTQTIRSNIIDSHAFTGTPEILIYGMLAAMLAAGVWLLFASWRGWPVSTTHSIVGAIIGFGVIELGFHAIHWPMVFSIVLSWIITPLIACVIAYLTFMSIQKFIINTDEPFLNAKKHLPIYIFIVTTAIVLVTIFKGIIHVGIYIPIWVGILFALGIALLAMLIGYLILKRVRLQPNAHLSIQYASVEKAFGVLMVFSASCMAFAHGSNDVSNAIGPLAAIVNLVQEGQLTAQPGVPLWILLLGAIGIVTGLAMYGYKVIATIGTKITALTPSRGFSAEFATATTVIIASSTGLPISTTQTLVGAILGVGFARGIAALNLTSIRNIFMSWAITLPAGAVLAVLFYYLLSWIF